MKAFTAACLLSLAVLGLGFPAFAQDTKPLGSPLESPIHMTILPVPREEVPAAPQWSPPPEPTPAKPPMDNTDSDLQNGGRR